MSVLLGLAGWGFWLKYRFLIPERTYNWNLHTQERSEEEELYERLFRLNPNEEIFYADWVQKHKERQERREKEDRELSSDGNE